jgi:hypothetical protein
VLRACCVHKLLSALKATFKIGIIAWKEWWAHQGSNLGPDD